VTGGPAFDSCAALGDYDRDGWIDLVVGVYCDHSLANNKKCGGKRRDNGHQPTSARSSTGAYLTKPIRQSTLLDMIMTALGPSVSVEDRPATSAPGERSSAANVRHSLTCA